MRCTSRSTRTISGFGFRRPHGGPVLTADVVFNEVPGLSLHRWSAERRAAWAWALPSWDIGIRCVMSTSSRASRRFDCAASFGSARYTNWADWTDWADESADRRPRQGTGRLGGGFPSPCQGEGRGFESRRPLQRKSCSEALSAVSSRVAGPLGVLVPRLCHSGIDVASTDRPRPLPSSRTARAATTRRCPPTGVAGGRVRGARLLVHRSHLVLVRGRARRRSDSRP